MAQRYVKSFRTPFTHSFTNKNSNLRIRRGQQISSLYSRIWEAKAFNSIVKSLSNRSKNVLLTSCLAAVFDWEKDKIPDDVLLKYFITMIIKRIYLYF